MTSLDNYLRAVIARVQKKFPDAGVLLVTVADTEDETRPEITYMTNMADEELASVVDTIREPEFGSQGVPDGRQTVPDEELAGAPIGETLH